MKWKKLGLVFCAKNNFDWMQTHAMVPIAEWLEEDRFRVYFTSRDTKNRGHGGYLEININFPQNILYLHDKPILSPGGLGCFDDSGVVPTSLVIIGQKKRLYYVGINLGVTVSMRNAIGLAEWDDSQQAFKRLFTGPVIDRSKDKPHFVASPEVKLDEAGFHAWFASCTKWVVHNEVPMHYYNLEYASSNNGIDWKRDGTIAIDFQDEYEYAIAMPRIIKNNNVWQMWFCSRATRDTDTYRIRYAESPDGRQWIRKDNLVGIDVSESGWDSEMICYPFVFDHKGKRYMLYNGNGYGRTGFGIATLESE